MLERMHRDALAGSARPRHLLLEVDSADGLFGAPHEIESAFTNLLVNGLKYTPEEGTVRMRWWSDEEGAYFAVIDTGIGIPAEHIPRLTERFYRVDPGRSRGEGGSGSRSAASRARAAHSPATSPRRESAGWGSGPRPVRSIARRASPRTRRAWRA
jgi:light-regulated signal transduction histidine kinase (bacteriophytochrome)